MIQDDTPGMLTEPVIKPIIRMALPASIGYFFNTMYNVVDTYWAGQLSTETLAGMSFSFPAFGILLALAIGVSAGTNALISNALGARNHHRAHRYQAQAITIGVLGTVLVAIPVYLLLEDIFSLMGARGAGLSTALGYTRVIVIGSPFFVLSQVWNAGLQARGDTKTYRNLLIVSFLANIALDPLLMFGFHPWGIPLIPALGEAGIALATVLIQAMGIIYIAAKSRKQKTMEGLFWRDFIPTRAYLKDIVGQSVPATVNFMTMALGSFVITAYLGSFGTNSVAAYGAAIRIEQIALIPTIGLNIALATMVGQNNGAGRLSRVGESFTKTLLLGGGIFLLIYTPVFIFARQLVSIFNSDPDVLQAGVAYLRIQAVTFYSYVILFQSNSVLQGLKMPGAILWIGLYRQLAAPLLVFTALAYWLGMGVSGIWWGLALVNWTAAVGTYFWSWSRIRRAKQHSNPPEEKD